MPERIPAERCERCDGYRRSLVRGASGVYLGTCPTCAGVGYVVPEAALESARADERAKGEAEMALILLALSDNDCPEESPTTPAEAVEHINGLRELAEQHEAAHAEGVREGLEKANARLYDLFVAESITAANGYEAMTAALERLAQEQP